MNASSWSFSWGVLPPKNTWYELCDLGLVHPNTHTSSPFHIFSSDEHLIVPPQKESVASFLRGHQRWAVQAFCINNKFIMHECGPLLWIDKWMWIGKCSILACEWKEGWNDMRSLKVQMCTAILCPNSHEMFRFLTVATCISYPSARTY